MSSTAPRAGKAREVLDWCRYGHQKMRDDPTGLDWVLVWAGTIALLRAVGHALEKEDAESDHRLKNVQDEWWGRLKATKPDPHIFWDFIERDRNLLLKEAELTVRRLLQGFLQDGIALSGQFRWARITAAARTPRTPATTAKRYLSNEIRPLCGTGPPRLGGGCDRMVGKAVG